MANLINTIRELNKELQEKKKQSLAASVLDTVNRAMDADDKDGDGLDDADPKQAKGKFKDRKDKDIDNDGDVDKSDKYLHKKRKAVSKAVDKKDEAETESKSKAKTADDVKKGKGTAKQEPIEVNPTVKEEVELDEAKVTHADEASPGKGKALKSMSKSQHMDAMDYHEREQMIANKKKQGWNEKHHAMMAKVHRMHAQGGSSHMYKEEVELDEARRDAPKGDKNTSTQNPIVVVYDDLGTKGRAGISGNMNLKTFMSIHGISAKHQGTLAKLVTKMGKGKKVEVPSNMLDDHKKEYEDEGKRVPKVWIELNTMKEEVEVFSWGNIDTALSKAGVKDATINEMLSTLNEKELEEANEYLMNFLEEMNLEIYEVELDEADKPPFAKPYKLRKKNVTDKSGAKHSPMSRARNAAQRGMKNVNEAEMTPDQEKKREEIVLSLKKKEGDFKSKYGERWKDVMYATATKMAMKSESGYKKK